MPFSFALDDRHSDLLTPSFALSGMTSPPSHSSLSAEELNALLTEMEPEIKSADRDLREIDILDKRGVLAAGKLPGPCMRHPKHSFFVFISGVEHRNLLPRLQTLNAAHDANLQRAADLERRISSILKSYASRVSQKCLLKTYEHLRNIF